MLTNLQKDNIKVNSWLLKESKMCVFSKKGMRNEVTFYKKKKKKRRSQSDLQVAVSGWKNKVTGTENVIKV